MFSFVERERETRVITPVHFRVILREVTCCRGVGLNLQRHEAEKFGIESTWRVTLATSQEHRRLFYNQLASLFKKLHTAELVFRPSLESDQNIREAADSPLKKREKKPKEK